MPWERVDMWTVSRHGVVVGGHGCRGCRLTAPETVAITPDQHQRHAAVRRGEQPPTPG
ncbi:MAG TPA: hypothetical protein VFX60_19060 [Micromonospora sp.]|nr:hypothetical protein [Micromonospora sp.]